MVAIVLIKGIRNFFRDFSDYLKKIFRSYKYAENEEDTKTWESWQQVAEIKYTQNDETKTIYISKHGSSGQLKSMMTALLDRMNPRPKVNIELEDGSSETL